MSNRIKQFALLSLAGTSLALDFLSFLSAANFFTEFTHRAQENHQELYASGFALFVSIAFAVGFSIILAFSSYRLYKSLGN